MKCPKSCDCNIRRTIQDPILEEIHDIHSDEIREWVWRTYNHDKTCKDLRLKYSDQADEWAREQFSEEIEEMRKIEMIQLPLAKTRSLSRIQDEQLPFAKRLRLN